MSPTWVQHSKFKIPLVSSDHFLMPCVLLQSGSYSLQDTLQSPVLSQVFSLLPFLAVCLWYLGWLCSVLQGFALLRAPFPCSTHTPPPSVALWSISRTSSAALLLTLEARPLLVPLLFLFARETLTILGKWIELLFKWKQLSSSMHFICGLWQVHRHYAGDSVGNPCLFSGFLVPTRISRVLLNESWSTPWNFQIDKG